MMKMKFYVSLCFFIVLFECLPAVAYNLEEAIERGLSANRDIKVQELIVEEAEKNKLFAYGNFLPTISMVLQETKLVNYGGDTGTNTDYLDQDSNLKSVRLSQPVFAGFYGMNTLKKAEYILESQKQMFENSSRKLVFDIRRQFIQYLKLHDDILRFEASVERLEKQLAASQAFYERQIAPKLHVMQAEVALARDKQSLIRVVTLQDTTRMMLNQLLGLDIDQKVIYSGSLAAMDFDDKTTLSEYVKDAKLRPDVQSARLNVEISKKDSLIIKSQNLPKVSVDFSLNDIVTNYDRSAYNDQHDKYWRTMLNVSMQLFHGGQTIASALKQDVITKRYDKTLQELLSKIEMQVYSSYASMLEARQRISSATSIKEAAARSYERAERRYITGLGTSVDVLNAQNDVSLADAEIAQARADFQVTKAELEYLTGK